MSDKDYSEARKAGILSPVEIDGEIFGLIGGGISTARTNIRHTTKADNVFRAIRNMEIELKESKRSLSDFIFEIGLKRISQSFKLIVEEESFYVVNVNTGIKVLESKSLYNTIFCEK